MRRLTDFTRRGAVALLAGGGFALAAATLPATAQDFPSEPITIVVPYSQGSNMSTYSRAVAPVLQDILGVPVVVKNVPGANGWLQVFSAKPDGTTIGVGDPTGQIGISIVQPLPYEVADFTWIGQFASGNQLLVASTAAGMKSLEDLAAAGKPIRCGTFGGLSAGAVQCAMLGAEKGFNISFVNTAGPPEVALAAVRGDIDIGSVGVNLWQDHIASGAVTPIVVWAAERDERVPDVPSLTDIGIPELGALTVYRAVFAPPGLPADRAKILRDALTKAQEDPRWKAFISEGNLDNNFEFSEAYADGLNKAFGAVKAQSELINEAFN
ncbi:tripartite tricarboxylate transporter substrate binding protein [Acuticoccus kandeliae]|uniref:tripartite tricarboxylate transporter substrate binding protein n=1 Tax=Acuticoccus kandeliae TaxID=2073160 RepID=UPI0013004ADE|nr:tripartite tricarboxylate transporter substrate binding protein [Acuticoccus kandeliae]